MRVIFRVILGDLRFETSGWFQRPIVLITHIPLARPEHSSCGPLRESGNIHQGTGLGYQNTLSPEASDFLLERLRPSAIFR